MTKYELLEYLADTGQANAQEVARAFGLPYAAAAMALLRLTRQGLVLRHVDPTAKIYWYSLSDRGMARLAYFEALEDAPD